MAKLNDLENIFSIVLNKENGISRQMFVTALGKVKSEESENVLIELLDDEEVTVYALEALGRLKSKKAKFKITLFTTHANSLVRKEAKALNKRMITKETAAKVSKLLGISATGNEQDWAIEFANKDRIQEFLDMLKTSSLSASEKYAIISLILASYDEYLFQNIDTDETLWLEIINAVNGNRKDYDDILNYWALWSEKGNENLFSITPHVRKYLHN